MDIKWIISGVVLVLVLIMAVIFIGHSTGIEYYKEKWNYPYATINKALRCNYFKSPQDATDVLDFHVNLTKCRTGKTRVIGFLEEDNLYGFLTCVQVSDNNYFCCAEVSDHPTKSFKDWKRRC